MDNEKIQELLLQLTQDMSFVKAKLSNIEEQKLSSRIDQLEARNREQETTNKRSYIHGYGSVQRHSKYGYKLILNKGKR